VPKSYVRVNVETGRKNLQLLEALQEHDDVQEVHANIDLPEELTGEDV
jgi:transcriptional/translational regulatory protein YebC/TACO1